MNKIYQTANEFYLDNKNIIDNDNLLKSLSFEGSFSYTNYFIKVSNSKSYLLAYSLNGILYLSGSISKIDNLIKYLYEHHLYVNEITGKDKLVTTFALKYSKLSNGYYIEYINKQAYKKCLIKEGNIKTAIFAGGCFWCMAKPYYELFGVKKVISGYAGGNKINPSYEETKKQLNNHKETVMIIYDNKKISYKKLLDVYFASIDPFDEEGQFIDKGNSYQTAIFTINQNEIKTFNNKVMEIEKEFKQKVAVKLLANAIFYPAETYHQNFALKYKNKFKEEEIISGRSTYFANKH